MYSEGEREKEEFEPFHQQITAEISAKHLSTEIAYTF